MQVAVFQIFNNQRNELAALHYLLLHSTPRLALTILFQNVDIGPHSDESDIFSTPMQIVRKSIIFLKNRARYAMERAFKAQNLDRHARA